MTDLASAQRYFSKGARFAASGATIRKGCLRNPNLWFPPHHAYIAVPAAESASTLTSRLGLRKIAGTIWTAEALAERLQRDADVYQMSGGGVTFSGGEPLMQWDFVSEVISRLKGINTAIETSGYTNDEIFRQAMGTLDLIMMDWKVSDPEKHRHYTGVDQAPIRRHAEMLAAGETPFILRMPIIPGVNDTEEHFQTAAEIVKDAKTLLRIDILPYQRAAGAKYSMVGRDYSPEFDEAVPPHFFLNIFDKAGIPYKVFR